MRTLMCTIAVAAVAAAGAAAGTQRQAALRVTGPHPLAVKGTGFAARERVKVTASTGGGTWRRVLVTSSTGSFAVAFGTASYDPCMGPLVVAASGPQDYVVVKRPPRECPPPG